VEVVDEDLSFADELQIDRRTAIAFNESLNNSVSAAISANSSSFKQSAI